MDLKKIIVVIGARPNFMKVAPLLRKLKQNPSIDTILVHTGQHYDASLSECFFKSLHLPRPNYQFRLSSVDTISKLGEIMTKFQKVCTQENPDLVVVFGDVTSTIGAALVAKTLKIKLAHVEAGIRFEYSRSQEELNRKVTDSISDFLFATDETARTNLLKEGHDHQKIHLVGNIMIDNLFFQLKKLKESTISPLVRELKAKIGKTYLCLTLHRPYNIESEKALLTIFNQLSKIAAKTPIIFPCHPRTLKCLKKFNISQKIPGIFQLSPLNYDDFLFLWKDAALIITDSGGLRNEAQELQIPCLIITDEPKAPLQLRKSINRSQSGKLEDLENLCQQGLKYSRPNSNPIMKDEDITSEKIHAVLARELLPKI